MTVRRDFAGYGRHRPDPAWPGGALVAVNFIVNIEEGAEYSIPDGDSHSESALLEAATPVAPGIRDLNAESVYEFGSRVGIWRVLNLFAEHGIPLTAFACAVALERNPDAARAIVEAGHDVCCHGRRWIQHWTLTEEDERSEIARAVASLSRTIGARPLGWYSRSSPGSNTRRLLVEEGGFLYDSDAYNDELPYWNADWGHPHLVIPYQSDTNDSKFANPAGFGSGADYFRYLRDSFDCLYREGATRPGMMSVGLHPRLVGRPGRAQALRRFLGHVRRHDRVWCCRRIDIAHHWMEHHPP
jgi:putative urate catabolism protein